MRQGQEDQPTAGADVVLIAYRALSPTQQEQAFELINQARLQRLAGEDSEIGRMLASLKRVADVLGEAPGIEEYKRIRQELQADGEQLEPSSRILKFFGSWYLAKEALGLSETKTARSIELRFVRRKLGKVWCYSDKALGDALAACVAEIGHVPAAVEFMHWRQRELELARARGEELHLPSEEPYRRRWIAWKTALRFFGYSEAEINGHLERE